MSLIAAAGALAAGGTLLNLIGNRKAAEATSRARQSALDHIDSEYYRDPTATIGNRALLKSLDERLDEQNRAMENRAVAGGATVENQLAARKANNQTVSSVYNNLLMGEDARRQALSAQRNQVIQQGYLQDAQNWQSWGSTMANGMMSLGSAALLYGGDGGNGIKNGLKNLLGNGKRSMYVPDESEV